MAVTQDKIQNALVMFDRDADGILLPQEVVNAQLSLGVYLNADQLNAFHNSLPKGPVEFAKAKEVILQTSQGRSPENELFKMFAPFDVKKDGNISLGELKAVMQTFGSSVGGTQVESVAEKFCNGDNLNYKALIAYLLS